MARSFFLPPVDSYWQLPAGAQRSSGLPFQRTTALDRNEKFRLG
jgi:hypothetical protein